MDLARHTLQRIMAETLKRLPADEIPIAAWEFAAGRGVAQKNKAVTFDTGVLTVEVADSTWRSQLSSMTPHLLSSLNHYSSVRIERLNFVVVAQVRHTSARS